MTITEIADQAWRNYRAKTITRETALRRIEGAYGGSPAMTPTGAADLLGGAVPPSDRYR